MSIFNEKKIDTHVHVLDPVRFPYHADVAYRPSGAEIGTTDQLVHVLRTYGVDHALLVQPNSGYGPDNNCMLDAIRRYPSIFKGIAIVDANVSVAELKRLRDQGVIGIAINPTVYGNAFYADAPKVMAKLADLGMCVSLQVEHDMLAMYRPWIEAIPVRVMIDHCGRPTASMGVDQPGFRDLLALAKTDRVSVKLSGYAKFSQRQYPFEDIWLHVRALVEHFGLRNCMWASDWPYLRATDRQDYGPLLKLVELLFPDPADRHTLLWETPRRLLGFASAGDDGVKG